MNSLLPGWCYRHRSTTQSLCFYLNWSVWRLRNKSSKTRSSDVQMLAWDSAAVGLASLNDKFIRPSDLEAHGRLCSASSSLIVNRIRLSDVGNRAFLVAVVRVWNELSRHRPRNDLLCVGWDVKLYLLTLITSAPSLWVFCNLLKTHFLPFLPGFL